YTAIGLFDHDLNGFEASDFTIDCNIAGQPSQKVACGGISVCGKHTRLSRLRVINYGTQTPSAECFVLTAGLATPGLDISDCVIEDCIVEQPGLNNARECTCISMSGSEDQVSGVMAFPRGCVIRNCVVNCEFRDRPVPISS